MLPTFFCGVTKPFFFVLRMKKTFTLFLSYDVISLCRRTLRYEACRPIGEAK